MEDQFKELIKQYSTIDDMPNEILASIIKKAMADKGYFKTAVKYYPKMPEYVSCMRAILHWPAFSGNTEV